MKKKSTSTSIKSCVRRFYILASDSNCRGMYTVVERYLGHINPAVFRRGIRFGAEWPDDAVLHIDGVVQSDLIGNSMAWMIASNSLLNILEPHLVNIDHEIICPRLIYKADGNAVSGYGILNIITTIRAIDMSASDGALPSSIDDYTFSSRLIPDDVNIFRVAESSSLIAVSDELIASLSNQGLVGVAAIATRSQ